MGRLIHLVRSISRRKKARPDTITEHAKFRRPIKDCRSRSVTERLRRNYDSKSRHFYSLSMGKRASIITESSVMPANWRVV